MTTPAPSALGIVVVGAGNAGHAMAADLSLAGASVCLYELPEFSGNLDAVAERGAIELTGSGRTGLASVRVTTDVDDALVDADCVFIVTQALAHGRLAELLAPRLRDGQAVVLFTSYGGAFLFRLALLRLERVPRVLLGETITLPYYCRITGPATVALHGKPYDEMLLGTLPADDARELVDRIQALYPFLRPAATILEPMLLNPNVVRHTVGTLMNIGRIEHSNGEFWIYREAFTPSVWRVFDALDAEKMAIMDALGLEPISYYDSRRRMTDYSLEGQARDGSKGPTSADTRYLTEDVPMGLVPRAELAEQLGVPASTHAALIHLASVISGTDFATEGRTLASLGLGGVAGSRLRTVIDSGMLESQGS